nr:hypothetical protein [Tanacetum cinerariifolium]
MTTPNVTSSTDNQMHNNIMAAGSSDRPLMLAPGQYPQWRSRFLRYVDTRPNGEALRKCILSGPYKPTTILVQAVEATDNSPAVLEHTTVMWEAIERLQQGESLNIQDVKTNLFWEFDKFTSHDGETMESYYTRFYKPMNEMIKNNLTVTTMQRMVNVATVRENVGSKGCYTAGLKDRPPMLATRRYAQWQSRFLIYIDTGRNGDALRKCTLQGPYTPSIVTIPAVPATDNTLAVRERIAVETILNMSPEYKARYESGNEAIHLLLTRSGDEIYSTVDACMTAHEMWIAIERLQQADSDRGLFGLAISLPLNLVDALDLVEDDCFDVGAYERQRACDMRLYPSRVVA